MRQIVWFPERQEGEPSSVPGRTSKFWRQSHIAISVLEKVDLSWIRIRSRVTEQTDCCKVVQPVSKGDHAHPGALDVNVGCRGLMNLYQAVWNVLCIEKTKGTIKNMTTF